MVVGGHEHDNRGALKMIAGGVHGSVGGIAEWLSFTDAWLRGDMWCTLWGCVLWFQEGIVHGMNLHV